MEEQSGKENHQFSQIKQEIVKTLEQKSRQLTVDDMLHWSLPLAAEQIKSQVIWDRFRDLTLEHQSNLSFKEHVNLAWSFTKAEQSHQ